MLGEEKRGDKTEQEKGKGKKEISPLGKLRKLGRVIERGRW